jgi:hypothetical protein
MMFEYIYESSLRVFVANLPADLETLARTTVGTVSFENPTTNK